MLLVSLPIGTGFLVWGWDKRTLDTYWKKIRNRTVDPNATLP